MAAKEKEIEDLKHRIVEVQRQYEEMYGTKLEDLQEVTGREMSLSSMFHHLSMVEFWLCLFTGESVWRHHHARNTETHKVGNLLSPNYSRSWLGLPLNNLTSGITRRGRRRGESLELETYPVPAGSALAFFGVCFCS